MEIINYSHEANCSTSAILLPMELPDFKYEKELWQKGYEFVAGADEVGRGSFAGPVTAACVVFAANSNFQAPIFNEFSKEIIINDSKKLRPRQREKAAEWIKENALFWAIGAASVMEINKLGVGRATQTAFRRAIASCELEIDYLLVDAFWVPYLRGLSKKCQKPIKKGDCLSISIAAASIVAKVERDALMRKLSRKFKEYGWSRNKGYGTREHQEAIQKHGITKHHRKAFISSFFSPAQFDI